MLTKNLRTTFVVALAAAAVGLGGCVGTVIGVTTDAAIAVAKVPFKVGGAIVDVATGDDEDDKKSEKD